MGNLSISIIVAVFINTGIIPGLFATLISTCPEKFEEDLSFNFKEPMDKCDNPQQEIVNLFGSGLQVVRDNFISSNILKSINLENNKIVDISPNAFNAVPNLSCLNIRWNNVTNIFENFLPSFNHTVLTKLNLAHTAFKNEQYNYYDHHPAVLRMKNAVPLLPNLTHLDISDNNLVEIPQYFESSFPRLTHLYLSDNRLSSSSFHHIPATTQYLYLERNSGEIYKSDIPMNVYGLFLSQNDFVCDSWRSNLYSNLRILSIQRCDNFVHIFNCFDNGKLIDLDISSNRLSDIRAGVLKNPKSLQRFSLDRNSLDSILFIASFNSLTDLSIAYNNLINITSNLFTNMQQLKKLNLRGNNIALIDKDAFTNLKSLEKLDLAENRLTTLPVSWMNTLTKLRYLNLKSNLFSSINNMYINVYSHLNNLFLGDNNITQIEMRSLKNLPSTVAVYLTSRNSQTCIT
ncbi:leucine-rich repeat-containing protein let-4-like [Polistes fuscatus]|uniref:leucine-rich repeat-containing protein let-4-like n=1 Tax=Polistes fuscatus TaxID=30207 RepID=UPI001CA7DF46|nr:leucine-rich repeat-containing protein let-4-like [Polistes fuscatus]